MTLTAALFVGGQSTRMGRDKALIEFGGEPLWSRQLNLLRRLEPERILLSCREIPGWCPDDALAVRDAVPACGPLGGFAAALGQTNTSHLLTLAIDLPKMNLPVLQELWNRARPGCGVVPVAGDFFEPLCAIYPQEILPAVRSALHAGQLSLQTLVRALNAEGRLAVWRVDGETARAFLNANVPADLERF